MPKSVMARKTDAVPTGEASMDPGFGLESASKARDWVRGVLDSWGYRDDDDVAVLLTSELVTNVVLHAGTLMKVHAKMVGRFFWVGVEDFRAEMPTLLNIRPSDTTGRGIRLVDGLSSSWGTYHTENGKMVWFEVPVTSKHQASH